MKEIIIIFMIGLIGYCFVVLWACNRALKALDKTSKTINKLLDNLKKII